MKRTPSPRRRKRDANYPSSRHAVYERAGGLCEPHLDWWCERQGHLVHHIAGRSGPDPHRYDDDIHSPDNNLLVCCRRCHDHIHRNPAWSYEHGWMRRRNGPTDA